MVTCIILVDDDGSFVFCFLISFIYFSFLFAVVIYIYFEAESLYIDSLSCSGTSYVDQAGLEFIALPASCPLGTRIKAVHQTLTFYEPDWGSKWRPQGIKGIPLL